MSFYSEILLDEILDKSDDFYDELGELLETEKVKYFGFKNMQSLDSCLPLIKKKYPNTELHFRVEGTFELNLENIIIENSRFLNSKNVFKGHNLFDCENESKVYNVNYDYNNENCKGLNLAVGYTLENLDENVLHFIDMEFINEPSDNFSKLTFVNVAAVSFDYVHTYVEYCDLDSFAEKNMENKNFSFKKAQLPWNYFIKNE